MNKGVTLKPLLESAIFNHTFDYDEWPATNNNTKCILKPYNKSIFALRHEYPLIFKGIYKTDEALRKKLIAANEKMIMEKM